MAKQLFFGLLALLFFSCKKESSTPVEIFLLKSFSQTVNQATNPATITISDGRLEDKPLVAGRDIQFYTEANSTFTLNKDIQTTIQNYGPDKGFAVLVDGQPVYYGLFRPLYLSSIVFGVAIIQPLGVVKNELPIKFTFLTGNTFLPSLDKRNDSRIMNALRAAGKLR